MTEGGTVSGTSRRGDESAGEFTRETQEEFAETVLGLVDCIPPGRVMTYGDIAEYLRRGGPRGVGGVMARDGAAVTWWRVVRVDGTLPPHLMIEAQTQWLHEGTPLRRGIVDIPAARWWPEPTHATDPLARHATSADPVVRDRERR